MGVAGALLAGGDGGDLAVLGADGDAGIGVAGGAEQVADQGAGDLADEGAMNLPTNGIGISAWPMLPPTKLPMAPPICPATPLAGTSWEPR